MTATKQSKIIFMNGKEKALTSLFNGGTSVFGYLAIGYYDYQSKNDSNGFKDAIDNSSSSSEFDGPLGNGFFELDATNGYTERLELKLDTTNPIEKDPDTGKVLAYFYATLPTEVLTVSQPINQIAIVDNKNIGADTVYYSATTFPTFTKTGESSITFVIGFKV